MTGPGDRGYRSRINDRSNSANGSSIEVLQELQITTHRVLSCGLFSSIIAYRSVRSLQESWPNGEERGLMITPILFYRQLPI